MESSLDRAVSLGGWTARARAFARPSRLATLYLVVASSVASAAILWAGRGSSFFSDEWEFVVARRGWTLDTFLVPHGEHIVALPVLVYKVLFTTVGLHAYWPYRCVLLFVHLACVWLVFRIARRRVGDPAAALAASFVLVLGSAWEMLLIPFELTLLGSVAFGLLALDGLDRGGRRGDIVALLGLIGATASSSAGLAFVAGVTVELVLGRAWRRLWIVAVPAVLYARWWFAYDRTATARVHLLTQVHAVPAYLLHSLEASASATIPLLDGSVQIVLMLAALLVLVRLGRNRTLLTARLGGLVAAGLSFWVLTGLGRAQVSGGENRYSYFGAVFLLLALVELARGARFDRRVGVGICVVLAASAVSNVRALDDGGAFLREHGTSLRAELTALRLVDSPLPAAFVPEPAWDPNLRVGDYLAAVRQLGSPTESAAALRAAPEAAREAADRVVLRAVPPTVRAVRTASCSTSGQAAELQPRARLLLVDATAPFVLHVRLFASDFGRSGAVAVGKGWHEVVLPAIGSDLRWHASAGGRARLCAV
jgi:hypothetical protein